MQQIKNNDMEQYLRGNRDFAFHFDKDSTIHLNANKIARELKNESNLRCLFIEEEFGYGKTEVAKYLLNHKDKLNLKNWTITYIDATTLEIMQDNKIGVLVNILNQILDSQNGENQNLSLLLSKLQNTIHRNTMGNLNISTILHELKTILMKENHLIIFDELDRTSREFSRFLMISIGNNISAYNTKILWILSDRKRIFPNKKGQTIKSNEFEKYGQYKIKLEKHDSRKIFENYFLHKGIKIDSNDISIISEIMKDKLPRYTKVIAEYMEKALEKKYPSLISLISSIIHYEQAINNDDEALFERHKEGDGWTEREIISMHPHWTSILFNSIEEHNIKSNRRSSTIWIMSHNNNHNLTLEINLFLVEEVMQGMGWLNE